MSSEITFAPLTYDDLLRRAIEWTGGRCYKHGLHQEPDCYWKRTPSLHEPSLQRSMTGSLKQGSHTRQFLWRCRPPRWRKLYR